MSTKKHNTRSISKIKHTKKNIKTIKYQKPIIIHIDGIPGAGKSYICTKINSPKSVCIDNDDIVLDAKNYVDSSNMPRTFKSLHKVIKQKINELIEKHVNDGKRIIIFVGVRFLVDTALNDANYRYFIKLSDLGATFRRVFMRETEKIESNLGDIKKLISDPKIEVDELDGMVHRKTNLALPYPPEFSQYKKHYKRGLGIAKKNNYKIASQDEIIARIQKIIC